MNYQLHDCEIDAVILEEETDRIIFSFPNGFHADGKNVRKLAFTIDRSGAPDDPLESWLFIRRIRRNRRGWKDLSFKQFDALFQKGNMIIYDEFDSRLTNRIMFQINACTLRSNIELFIEDINDVVLL